MTIINDDNDNDNNNNNKNDDDNKCDAFQLMLS